MKTLNQYIEHTMLKQDATKNDLIKLFTEAKENKFLGVCINPCYVKSAKEYLKDTDVKIVTVIGFPLGANTTETKIYEIDMVINVTKIKDQETDFIIDEIKLVKAACGGHNLKVILETDLLTKDEIVYACECCVKGGADFVKTSTGFVKNGVGAKTENVELMYKTVSPFGLQVKASGGIRDKETATQMIKAGAVRLGTSSGIKIVS